MKTLFISLFLFVITGANAQVAFGVSPGQRLNGAYFGLQVGEKFITSIGI